MTREAAEALLLAMLERACKGTEDDSGHLDEETQAEVEAMARINPDELGEE